MFDVTDFFSEDVDLLDLIEEQIYINEFEVNGQKVGDEEDEQEYSMDDDEEEEESQENAPAKPAADEAPHADEPQEYSMDDDEDGEENEPQQAQGDDAPPADEPQEYSMDDDEDGEPEGQVEPAADEAPPADDEPESYEIPDDDEGGEGEPSFDGPGDAPPADDEPQEYSMDGDTPEGEESEAQQGEEGEDPPAQNEAPPADIDPRLSDLETVIFDKLSEEEKKLKIKELKELFIEVHKRCGTISEKVSDLKTDEDTIRIAEYISNTLVDLQRYLDDYINNIFDTKTYVENIVHLQKYITIFNAINKIFDEINKSIDK